MGGGSTTTPHNKSRPSIAEYVALAVTETKSVDAGALPLGCSHGELTAADSPQSHHDESRHDALVSLIESIATGLAEKVKNNHDAAGLLELISTRYSHKLYSAGSCSTLHTSSASSCCSREGMLPSTLSAPTWEACNVG